MSLRLTNNDSMNLSDKNKAYLLGGLSLGVVLLLLFVLGEIILPFVFAMFIAFLLNPVILNIQKRIKNRNLAITGFLLITTVLLGGTIFLMGGHVVKDTKRLVGAVETFAEENNQAITETKNSVLSFFDEVYESEVVQSQIANTDSITIEGSSQKLMSAIGSVYSFFESPDTVQKEPKAEVWSPFYMVLYTILYTIFILYTYDYFEEKYVKYLGDRKPLDPRLAGIWGDFNIVFVDYFRQRSKVVLINALILITAFTILDLPGAIIIAILAAILSYASHFHYLSLPLVGIGCWALSIENDTNFFIYFGIIVFVFIIISVLEETLYFDKIMKTVNGMNPAIMVFAFTLWIYVFGGFTGTIIALPLTQLILLYMDRILLFSKEQRQAL